VIAVDDAHWADAPSLRRLAWRTHLGSVSADPTPSRLATAQIAGQSEGQSGRTSATIRTARSRNSGG
jgi:hypothetical protein